MGQRSGVRWDSHSQHFYTRFRRKKYYLGKTYPQACRRFAEIVGREADAERPVVVAEAVAAWCQSVGASRWTREMLAAWSAYAGTDLLSDLRAGHLAEFAAHLRADGNAPKTVIHRVSPALRVLVWCHERGHIERLHTMPKLPRPITRPRDQSAQQIADVWAKIPERTRPVLGFILWTGCRPSEACRLRWREVDLNRGVCELQKHKTASRTGKTRIIALTAPARRIIEAQPTGTDFVFLSRLQQPYTYSGLRSILYKRGIVGGVYSLRHTFAQTALESGATLEDVAAMLGHNDLRTVTVYAQLRADRAVKAASRLVLPLPGLLDVDAQPSTSTARVSDPLRETQTGRPPESDTARSG